MPKKNNVASPHEKITTLIFTFKSQKVVYFRVPKAASTSILMAFRRIDSVERRENDEYNKSAFKFAFVRNPFDRLASCFRHVIQKGTPETLDSCPGMHRNMSFGEFVDAVRKIKVPKMDMHFRPQYTFIPEKPDFLGKFENINEDFLELCEKIGVRAPPELTRQNITDKTRYDIYAKESIEKVLEIYKKDFEIFGYLKELPAK